MDFLPVQRFIHSTFFLFAGLYCAASNAAYSIEGFNEKVSEQVDVSGGILIGFHYNGSSPAPNLSSLFIARPKSVEDFYLKIRSVDGVYSAEMKVSFDNWTSSWAQIVIPSEHQKFLRKYTKDELVVYAYRELAERRGSKTRKFHLIFPSSWGEPFPEDEVNGRFFINSALPTASYSIPELGTSVFCKPISAEIRTAFNRTCRIDAGLKNGNNTIVMNTGRNKKYVVWLP